VVARDNLLPREKGFYPMKNDFKANGLPVLIGSLPVDDHAEAVRLIFEHTPEIPLWAQLPFYREEGMIAQFLNGLPGIVTRENKTYIDTSDPHFGREVLEFYEDYMAVDQDEKRLDNSRFAMNMDTARGFYAFFDHLQTLSEPPVAVKGQITGPITFCLGVTDQNGKAIFYDDQLRDAAVKLLARKAKWQVAKLSQWGRPVIIFIDEPALGGFGSSAFIGISKDDVVQCLQDVMAAVHAGGGLVGVHVCSNFDWPLVLDSESDIISFDAYAFFDKLILYPAHLKRFVESGGVVAWGIVPTLNAGDIEKENASTLTSMWEDQMLSLAALGIEEMTILSQSLITPSCGTGSLSLDLAKKVLTLTREVSDGIRKKYNLD
jgi:methionine synthase II (cobalamin-independent)